MTPDEVAAELDRRRVELDAFDARWHAYVHAWRRAVRDGVEEARALVDETLRTGLPTAAAGAGRAAPAADAELSAARALVAASGYLDAAQYAVRHRLRRDADPVRHYAEDGWRLLQNPSPRFDLWAYWVEHLDPTAERVDPLLHWLVHGRHLGLAPVPEPASPRVPAEAPASPRRICLFAAHDRDGLVDDYVVTYLAELSRHADVYYLADGVLEAGQLDRLAGVTAGAWSIPHGGYDFGSFSMLARDLVGWDRIGSYDELLLANDSCFLVHPLDDVLAAMDGRACDWWSLQATSMEHDENYFTDDSPIPLAEAKARFLGPRQWSDVRYLHLSSYFLVFRRPVIADPGFRWRLGTVAPQTTKGLVVHKYEIGLSRYLTDAGFDFDTWLDALHAFHPLYSRRVFDLLDSGFPLVKRNFLGENPRRAPGVGEWPQRLREIAPTARVDEMVANIDRVTDPGRRHDAYDVTLDPHTGRRHVRTNPFPASTFKRLDRETPTFDHWWGVMASPSGRLDPGLRAVLDVVRDDPTVRVVVFSRSRPLADELRGARLDVVPLETVDGQEALVRCGVVLVAEAPDVALPVVPPGSRRRYVHVGGAGPTAGDWALVDGTASAGKQDALVRAATTPGLDLARVLPTGLPRHDLLLRPRTELPADLAAAETRLRERLDGRPLVVWWSDTAPSYASADVEAVGSWVRDTGSVIGVREDVVDRADSLTRTLAPTAPWGLSDRSAVPWIVTLRVASAVVTDGAPHALDARLLGTPVLLHRPSASEVTGADPLRDGLPRHDDVPELLDAIRAASDAAPERPPEPFGQVPLDGAAARRLVEWIRTGR